MIDDFRDLAQRKITPPALTPLKNEYQTRVALAETNMRLGAARAFQGSSLGSVWQTLSRGETPTAAQRAAIGMMAIHGLQEALKIGEITCEAAGTAALYASSPFERRRRDLITTSNHIIGQRRTLRTMVNCCSARTSYKYKRVSPTIRDLFSLRSKPIIESLMSEYGPSRKSDNVRFRAAAEG